MENDFRISLVFPLFRINIHSNSQPFIHLIRNHFFVTPEIIQESLTPSSPCIINFFYHKIKYSEIPRSQYDCFHGFTLFYNRYAEYDYKNQDYKDSRVCYDVGPRTLKTVIDFKNSKITSYAATPSDFENDLLFDLVFFQPLKCLLQVRCLYLFHSSCVVKNQKAVLFTGKSGSGKSTLALTLLRNGFKYLSDDEVILRTEKGTLECSAFFSRPKILKRSLAFFPELKKMAIKNSTKKDKAIVDLESIAADKKVVAASPAVLIFPRFVNASKTRLEPLDKQKALSRLTREELMQVKFSDPEVNKRHFLALAVLLRQVKVYQLFYQDKDLDKIPAMITPLVNDDS